MNAPAPSNGPIASLIKFREAALAVVVVTLLAFFGALGPGVPIKVATNTTVLLEPLAADGLPDYASHILNLVGRGTPPDENAAVPLLAACWPMGLAEADMEAVCREIGADATPPSFIPIDQGLGGKALPAALSAFMNDRLSAPRTPDELAAEIHAAVTTSPWRGEEIPPLRDWLEERAAAIDLAVSAADRPTLYLPPVALLNGTRGEILFGLSAGTAWHHRSVANALRMRAMMRLGEGHSAEAWHDILAIHKLSRLAAGPDHHGSLVSGLIACAHAHWACDATIQVLEHSQTSAAVVSAVRHDLAALPPFVTRHRLMEIERLCVVAWVVHLASVPPFERSDLFVQDLMDGNSGRMEILSTSLDWNCVLKHVNAFYDTLDQALAAGEWANRQPAFARIEAALRTASTFPQGDAKVAWLWSLLTKRDVRSRHVGTIVTLLLGPSMMIIDIAITRAEARLAMTTVAVALAGAKTKDGRYPDNLDDLVPDFLELLPADPFTGKPPVYERRGDGYLLYSLGPNAVDDSGTDYDAPIVRGEWSDGPMPKRSLDDCDFVIRVPKPVPRALEHFRPPERPERKTSVAE
jgi:hypothetical protein